MSCRRFGEDRVIGRRRVRGAIVGERRAGEINLPDDAGRAADDAGLDGPIDTEKERASDAWQELATIHSRLWQDATFAVRTLYVFRRC